MPTNLRRLLARAADADPLNTANADVQQMIADGTVIRRSKICPVKHKPVKAAYNTKTEEFYYNADGSAMTLREWRTLHGVQPKKQKQRSDTGLRQVIQPGDAIHCRRAEIEMWLNKKPARYTEPLPPDFPGVRVDDAALKPREHAIPEATTGQNAFLKACREFLICDDATLKRISRGMSQLEAMRTAMRRDIAVILVLVNGRLTFALAVCAITSACSPLRQQHEPPISEPNGTITHQRQPICCRLPNPRRFH